MSIHSEHPFTPAEADRSPVRRLRGRLTSPVTVWTTETGSTRAGLTVSSMLVADGEPGAIVAIIDPLADVWDVLQVSRRVVVNVLSWPDRSLADAFGYVAPAPGGPFRLGEWQSTEWGPALASAEAWAGCRLSERPPVEVGWGLQLQLQLEIEHVQLNPAAEPLTHRRGRYQTF